MISDKVTKAIVAFEAAVRKHEAEYAITASRKACDATRAALIQAIEHECMNAQDKAIEACAISARRSRS
jgi:hypothetical protein